MMKRNPWEELYRNQNMSDLHAKLSYFNGESYRLGEADFDHEIMGWLRQYYSGARVYIDALVEKLVRENYRFAFPDGYRRAPDPSVLEWAQELSETKGIYLPLTLTAWICEIGNVNLCGSHPQWEKSGYAFEGDINDVWYTDSLVFEVDREYILYEHEEWLYRKEEYGEAETGPFRFSIAPDSIHKANVSGGPPYEILADRPQVDTLLINERHGAGVAFYLRNSLDWGGFPGFEYMTKKR